MNSRPWAAAVVIAVAMACGGCGSPPAASGSGTIGPLSAPPPPPPEPARAEGTIHGQVAPSFAAFIDGQPLAVPVAEVAVDAPAEVRIDGAPALWAAPPLAGYASGQRPGFALGYRAPASLPARGWSLHISRFDNGKAVRTLGDRGPPPKRIEWDGLDDRGEPLPARTLLLAQLDVRSVGGAGAASPRVPFALAQAPGPKRRERIATGEPFDSSGNASPELARLLDDIASSAVPGSKVSIEVHADGSGERLAAIARTQRESQRIAGLLVDAGVPGRVVEARGRGSLEPLEAATTDAARRRNRRVVATIETPGRADGRAPLRPPRAAPPVSAGVSLSGVPLRIDAAGSFSFVVPPVARGGLLQLRASDGRRASTAITARETRARRASDASGAGTVRVVGDVRAGTVAVDGDSLPSGWARVRVELAPAREADVALALRVPGELDVRSWRLEIAALGNDGAIEPGGERIARGKGVPPRVWMWDGRDDQGRPRLEPGARFRVSLEIRGPGNAGWSPTYELAVPPARWRGLSLETRRLFRGTRPSSGTRTFLSRFSALARRRSRMSFSLRLTVAADRGTVAESRLALAARLAAVRNYLKRLRVSERRYDLHGDLGEGPDGAGSLRIGEQARNPQLSAPEPTPARLVIDGQAQRVPRSGRVSSKIPYTGGTVVVEVARPTGHRARYSVRK